MKPLVVRLFPLPTAAPRDPAVDAWLAVDPGPLGDLGRRWFAALRAAGPDVAELVHDGQATACVGTAAFAYLSRHRAHLNLGFYAGADLPDPVGLLQGTGRFMRHVKLRPEAPPDEAALAALVAAAYRAVRDALDADRDAQAPT